MKRIYPLVAAALCSAVFLSGCGERTESDALTILGKKSDLEKTYMTRIFDLYREETGETLSLLPVEDALYETTALDRFAKGKGPDLFLHFNNADLRRFDPAYFCDLSGESWVDDLTESAYAYCAEEDGTLLGLPFWESSVSGCYYNKTLLERELGLRAVSTQADFDGLCRALKAVGRTPICWPADGCSWMLQFGLDPIFADNPALLDSLNRNEITYAEIPAVSAMIRWISNAAESGWFGTNYTEIGWDQISETMSSGEAVMTFLWDTWFYTDFKPGKYTIEDFALMPVFLNTTPEGTYEGGNLNMMLVNQNSAKREKALDFLRFCAEPEHYNIAFAGIPTVSCFRGMTTNIQSEMVTNAQASIRKRERVSTAATKIIGYSADEIALSLNDLFRGKLTIAECVAKLDEDRIEMAKKLGTPGF